jgi:hypothetical protein
MGTSVRWSAKLSSLLIGGVRRDSLTYAILIPAPESSAPPTREADLGPFFGKGYGGDVSGRVV